MSFRRQLDRWLLGIPRSFLQGGAIAVKATIAVATASGVGLPVQNLDLKQIGIVWLGGALVEMAKYLSANPLPDLPAENQTKTP